ncbi:unnamed protein product [Peniophora sp. CBMAI 1063]|nr:unnamed protein product [Peniophora sp. CBMAI 1063]
MDAGETDWRFVTHKLFINYAFQAAPLVLLYYDYLLTLGDEIENYWPPRRPLTWLSGLFLGTRYFTLLSFVPILVTMVWGTASAYFHAVLELFLQIPIGVLCSMRVYALYSRDRRILIGLLILGVVLTGITVYMVTRLNDIAPVYYWPSAPLCTVARTGRDGVGYAVMWGAVLLFDLVIFLLTALRAFRVWKAGRIVQVVLRDGVIYFCALSGANIINIVVLLVATPLLKTTFSSMTNIISVVLISRLMLNLRSDLTPSSAPTDDTELTATSAPLDTNIMASEGYIGTHRSTAYPTRTQYDDMGV